MMSSSKVQAQGQVRRSARLLVLGCAAAALCLPAHALYKVIGPDGKVTYTDRPPAANEGKVTPLTSTGSTAPAIPNELPLELRQVAARYPVTLYVIGDCTPCDAGRKLLRQRGIPHAERIVATEEDAEALLRLTGTRDLPAMTLGAQVLRGFSAATWDAYLDTAGYPRESRLPAGYAFAAAAPVVPRAEPQRAPAAASAPELATRSAPATSATAPSGIRF